MRVSAHRTLRICLAVTAVLVLTTATTSASETYIVRKGDTLWRIGKRFSTTVSALTQVNKLDPCKPIVPGQVLIIPANEGAAAQKYILDGRAECVRDGVELKAEGQVVEVLSRGTELVMLARAGDSLRVRLSDGRIGWVPMSAILAGAERPAHTGDRYSIRRDIVRTAYACRGARYRRGGESRRGFDCSGFVKYLYSTKGIKLPHSSSALFKWGLPVAQSSLQPGDLVFFKSTYRGGISHVGLYVGEGKFIHASTRRSGVRVDYLNSSYYRRRYAGAKRI